MKKTDRIIRNWKNHNWMLKTLVGILYNLAGAYLLFYPSCWIDPNGFYHPLVFIIAGIIGLLFSYYIFYKDILIKEK